MTARLTILIVILTTVVVILLLSRDILHPRIRKILPISSDFNKITLLLLLVIGINFSQSLWILTERTPLSFHIPGDPYKILPRDFSDFNSFSKSLPTLYAIQNLYIALDELTTEPRIYSINELVPSDSENQSKLYGTVWPSGEIKIITHVDPDSVQRSLKKIKPNRTGTIYNTLRKTDSGIDWRIYVSKDDASTDEVVVLSDTIDTRTVWIFVDTRLLNDLALERLQ